MISTRVIGNDLDNYVGRYADYIPEVRAMRRRRGEFPSKLAMQLAGFAMNPTWRSYLMDVIDKGFRPVRSRKRGLEPEFHPEVIAGGGLHGSIYAAARVAAGKPMPLVIERRPKVGAGIFGVAEAPAFWLNSRNRPGAGGLPSENAALNAIPGAPVQLSHLSAVEFQSNADMAFVSKVMLARSAKVKAGVGVERIIFDYDSQRLLVLLSDGSRVLTDRVIDARGLGDPLRSGIPAGTARVMDFVEFLERLNKPFPLQGMKRVAVVGGGDSARVVIEALFGQGPAAHMSVAALDWVEQIDWYALGTPGDCQTFKATARGRYARIGSFLTPPTNGVQRLRVSGVRGQISAATGDTVTVNGRIYDHVIWATGWTRDTLLDYDYFEGERTPFPAQTQRFGAKQDYAEVYTVGPAAELPFDSFEVNTPAARLPENLVALFRLGWRTAALAEMLP